MTDVEFVIPSNKDELLQQEPGQYYVKDVFSLAELSQKLSGEVKPHNSLKFKALVNDSNLNFYKLHNINSLCQ
jgi:hypothetical protein